MIADHDLKKAICPSCVTEVRIDVVFEEKTFWSDANVDGADRYWILKCRGCDRVFFGHGSTFSENTDHVFNDSSGEWHMSYIEEKTYYPRALKRKKPDWFNWNFDISHGDLSLVMNEVYAALDHELLNIGTTGIRTVFELVSQKLKVDQNLSFKDKIEDLRKRQHITGRERDYLQILVDAGGAAAHAGWRPSADHVTTLMEILEGLIHRALILPNKADGLQAALSKHGSNP